MKRTNSIAAKRLQAVFAAAADERRRMNEALHNGAAVVIRTFCGEYRVTAVSDDWWYSSLPVSGSRDSRSWCGCNDGQWADMMRQAGIDRNPLFA